MLFIKPPNLFIWKLLILYFFLKLIAGLTSTPILVSEVSGTKFFSNKTYSEYSVVMIDDVGVGKYFPSKDQNTQTKLKD